jgi:hypothetical protein
LSLTGRGIFLMPMTYAYIAIPDSAIPRASSPIFHRGQNPEEFKAALKGEPVEVRLLNWYPSPPAAK